MFELIQSISYFQGNTLHMVHYISQHQIKIEEFGNLYQMKLNPFNRWVQLAKFLPWDSLVRIYSEHFSKRGAVTVSPRIVIGSLIIKHKLNLSDEQTVQIIEENPYMQFFLGFDEFIPEVPFSPSLFVEWRKKLGNDTFNDFSDVLFRVCFPKKTNSLKKVDEEQNPKQPNKGKLKMDATIADQYITYPNDLGLLNKARENTEEIIDILFDLLREQIPVKPRTYRKEARKRYLAEAKKRQKNKTSLRMAIRFALNCLDRNIRSINKMLDLLQDNPLPHNRMRQFWIIQTLNDQQRQMYDERINRCDHRIVSISQPHVRPMVRGKQGKKVEFGAKLGLALADGFVKAQTISWDAYNESADLIPHIEAYKELYGYYPELVQVDKIYGTNKNRKWCTLNGIRMTVSPKGRPKEMTKYQKRKHKKELSERNEVEGKIGQAKQGYRLNEVKAKLRETSETWIGLALFTANLVKFAQLNGFHF